MDANIKRVLRRELWTAELKRIVSHGVLPTIVKYLPLLKDWAGADALDDATAALVIRDRLDHAVGPMGAIRFLGKTIEADTVREAYRVLLDLEGSRQPVDPRRMKVMGYLSAQATPARWAKSDKLERAFLRTLADHLLRDAPENSEQVA